MRTPPTANSSTASYLFSLEPRRLDDIRALGNNAAEDDARFATAARVAEINLGLYRSMLAPPRALR